MRAMLAAAIHCDHKSMGKGPGKFTLHEGGKPAHLAYRLCYPFMVAKDREFDNPGPWDHYNDVPETI